jgi:hypothetical protein
VADYRDDRWSSNELRLARSVLNPRAVAKRPHDREGIGIDLLVFVLWVGLLLLLVKLV